MTARSAAALLAMASFLLLPLSGGTIAGPNPDSDGDGVFDLVDNCTEQPNNGGVGLGPPQHDSDEDGFGNICDADFNQTGTVNGVDFGFFISCFLALQLGGSPVGVFSGDVECIHMDMNGSDSVNITDFGFYIARYTDGQVGPSGLPCAVRDSSAPNMSGRHPCVFDPSPND